MSGHSKWATIHRKKGLLDAARGKVFQKLAKEIMVAAKSGSPDPNQNSSLRLAVDKAKAQNMPKENIVRAISKASDKDAASFQEVSYEGYGPNGVAIFIECATDNVQRTVANIRSYFNKHNGSLGTNGSLSFIFDRKGVFRLPKGNINPDEFELEVIEAGAEDISYEDDSIVVTTALEDFGQMMKKIEAMGIETESAELQRIPKTTTSLDKESAQKVLKLIEIFEDDDDVQSVFHNLELTDELLNELG